MYLCHMNTHEFKEKVADYIRHHELVIAGDNVVVALSGGADSVALLHALMSLNIKCSALHCNFGLRGAESDRDESFVRNLCDSLGVALKVEHFDVPAYEQKHKVSTEMACRELRYAWFEQERLAIGAKYIAVAHHHDDNVETFFLNMLRGTGIQGLSGIKPKNGNIIRPLLCVSRKEVEDYLKACGLSYVVDSTNLENDFKRNKIRNVLIPAFKDLFPNFETGIARTLDNLQGCADFYRYSVEQLKQKCVDDSDKRAVKVSLRPLKDVTEGRETAFFEIMKDFGFNSDQSREMYDAVAKNDSVGNRCFSKSYEAVIGREEIEIFPIIADDVEDIAINLEEMLKTGTEKDAFSVVIKEKEIGTNCLEGVDGRISIALNMSILKETAGLVLRKWQKGDVIHPYGMKGSKLVSDLFVDNKFTESQKRQTQVLAIGNEVIWVLGVRATGKYSVNRSDGKYLKLSLK